MAAARRHPDAEATRAAILLAAQELFLDQGFAATSMSQLAKAAGVTKSLIHHHFQTKDKLWLAVKHEIFGEYGLAQREILEAEGTPEEVMRKSFTIYFRFLQDHPEVARLFVLDKHKDHASAEATDEECLGDGVGDLFGLGLERIRLAQQAGLARKDVDPISVLVAFFSLAEHWFMSKEHVLLHVGADREAEIEEKYLEDAIKLLVASITLQ